MGWTAPLGWFSVKRLLGNEVAAYRSSDSRACYGESARFGHPT
jgi:hypothetical protein